VNTEARKRALPYLRGGCVTVLTAETPSDQDRPSRAVVRVQGHYGVHVVDLLSTGRWSCAPCQSAAPCAHVAAAQMVLGYVPGEA
jgi:hypothetical protein